MCLFNLCNGPIRTPAAYEEQSSETIQGLIVGVGDHFLLWSLLIKPRLPLLLISAYLKKVIQKDPFQKYINDKEATVQSL